MCHSNRAVEQAFRQGRAIADVAGDPFGTAAEYAAMDAGTYAIQPGFEDLGPTQEEVFADDLATITRHRLLERFTGDEEHDDKVLAEINARNKATSLQRQKAKEG